MASTHTRRRVRGVVPAVLSCDSRWGVLVNVMFLTLAVIAGEWTVHQIEYLIVYGPRFGSVMAAAPHRAYMQQAGLLLALMGVSLLLFALAALLLGGINRRRLLRVLPQRVHCHIPAWSWQVPISGVVRGAVILFICQTALYVAQENIESAIVGSGYTGLSMVLSPQRPTIVPILLLVAVCSSFILWTASTWLGWSRRAVGIAKALVKNMETHRASPDRQIYSNASCPTRHYMTGGRGLRSPPLFT